MNTTKVETSESPRRPDPAVLRLRTREGLAGLEVRRNAAKANLVLRGEAVGAVAMDSRPEPVGVPPLVPASDPTGVGRPAVAGLVSPQPAPPPSRPVTETLVRPPPPSERVAVPLSDSRPASGVVVAEEKSPPVPSPSGRNASSSLLLRKKQPAAPGGGRVGTIERIPNPVCFNCRIGFRLDDHIKPLARISCPRCSTRQVVPARIDQFILERELGRGGMGTTYQAFDTSLHRNVAIKLLTEGQAGNQGTVETMIREARRVAALSHPHIVPVYSIGNAGGMPYLVMELLTDRLLARPVMRNKQLDELFVVKTGLAISLALSSAAEVGILHLDIKPANILHDRIGVAKLIDFGLACHLHDDQSDLKGTCFYVAPERLRDHKSDFRSDQYSLGLTLWQALAGRQPFEAERMEQMMFQILMQAPPLLDEARPGLNEWTTGLVHKMISPDPADRYQDYGELIWAFEFVLDALHAPSAEGVPPPPSP